jgi:hypothetical protein
MATQQDLDRARLALDAETAKRDQDSKRISAQAAMMKAVAGGPRYSESHQVTGKSGYNTGKGDKNNMSKKSHEYEFTRKSEFGNHPVWYTNYEGSKRAGTVNWFHDVTSNQSVTMLNTGGTLVVGWIPTVPQTNDVSVLGSNNTISKAPDAGIKSALQETWITTRAANAGAKNYEPSNIGIINYAIDSFSTIWHELYRAYRLRLGVNPQNEYERSAALRALGFNPTIQQEALERVHFALVEARRRAKNLALPAIPLFDRHAYLASSIFRDEDLKTSKTILYRCEVYGLLTEPTNGLDTSKRVSYYTIYPGGNVKYDLWDRYVGLLDAMLGAMENSTDYATIMGDLRKAYGDSGIELPEVDISGEINPVYDVSVLAQLDNTTLVGAPVRFVPDSTNPNTLVWPAGPYDIMDANGFLAQGVWRTTPILGAPWNLDNNRNVLPFLTGSPINDKVIIVDSPVEDPSPEDVLVLTRNIVGGLERYPSEFGFPYEPALGTDGQINVKRKLTAVEIAWDQWNQVSDGLAKPSTGTVGSASSKGLSCSYATSYGTEVFTQASFFRWNSSTLTAYDYGEYNVVGSMEHHPTFINSGVRVIASNNAQIISESTLKHMHYAAAISEFTPAKSTNPGRIAASGRYSRQRR